MYCRSSWLIQMKSQIPENTKSWHNPCQNLMRYCSFHFFLCALHTKEFEKMPAAAYASYDPCKTVSFLSCIHLYPILRGRLGDIRIVRVEDSKNKSTTRMLIFLSKMQVYVNLCYMDSSKSKKYLCRILDTRTKVWNMCPTFLIGHWESVFSNSNSQNKYAKTVKLCTKFVMTHCKQYLFTKIKEIY